MKIIQRLCMAVALSLYVPAAFAQNQSYKVVLPSQTTLFTPAGTDIIVLQRGTNANPFGYTPLSGLADLYLPIGGGTLSGALTLPSLNVTGSCTGCSTWNAGTVSGLGANFSIDGSHNLQGAFLPLSGGSVTVSGLAPTGNNGTYIYWANSTAATTGTPTNAGLNVFYDDTSTNGTQGAWGILGHAAFDGTTSQNRPYIGVEGLGVYGSSSSLAGPTAEPPVWGMIADAKDFSNARSGLTNALTSLEADLETNNVDDGNERQGVPVILVKQTSAGVDPMAYAAFHAVTNNAGSYKFGLRLDANYNQAAIDLRSASSNGANSGSLPTVASPGTTGTVVPVTDVLPFTSDMQGRDINTTGNGHIPEEVLINGNLYQVTGYTVTGNGPAGTLTTATSVGSDGTTGNTVLAAAANAIWLNQGQTIAFDWAGTNGIPNVTISGDGSKLNVKGGLSATGLIYPAEYTVATLPTCNSGSKGALAEVTDQNAAPTYRGSLTGGGSITVPVMCNGTTWEAH